MINKFSILIPVLLIISCTQGSKKALETDNSALSPVEKGRTLVLSRNCTSCHSIDGSRLVGPSFKGIFGTDVKLADGKTVKIDESYLRESIESPLVKIVEGYAPSMPAYKGSITDEEIASIIEYIKSLR